MYNKSTLSTEMSSTCLVDPGVSARVIYAIPLITERFEGFAADVKSSHQVSEPSTKQLIHSSRLTSLFPSVSQDSEGGK